VLVLNVSANGALTGTTTVLVTPIKVSFMALLSEALTVHDLKV